MALNAADIEYLDGYRGPSRSGRNRTLSNPMEFYLLHSGKRVWVTEINAKDEVLVALGSCLMWRPASDLWPAPARK